METEKIIRSWEEPKYKCNKCQDRQLILFEKNGYLYAKRCDCRYTRITERLLEESGLDKQIQTMTFNSFIASTPLEIKMKKTAEEYLNALHNADENRWLFIGGNPGCGKTHLCTAVCGELIKMNIGVYYMLWPEIVIQLKQTMYARDSEYEKLINRCMNAPVLYIDDLFKKKHCSGPDFTEADINIAFMILNRRYYQNKPTIISCEWDLIKDLLPVDEGVFSRVYERCKDFMVFVDRNPAHNFRFKVQKKEDDENGISHSK